jgi:hypothetical protein
VEGSSPLFFKGALFYGWPNSLLFIIEPVLFMTLNVCGRFWGNIGEFSRNRLEKRTLECKPSFVGEVGQPWLVTNDVFNGLSQSYVILITKLKYGSLGHSCTGNSELRSQSQPGIVSLLKTQFSKFNIQNKIFKTQISKPNFHQVHPITVQSSFSGGIRTKIGTCSCHEYFE